ncbi:MAG: MnmC family methyltransferase [Thermoprotei archaeon]
MYVVDWLNESVGQVFKIDRVLVSERTLYQEVLICTIQQLGKALFLDGQLQSTQCDLEKYHEALTEPSLRAVRDKPATLVIGGAEGATVRHALGYSRTVTMVDIDERLVELCRTYLEEFHSGAFADTRLNLVFEDGALYVTNLNAKFDVVIVDGTDPSDRLPGSNLYTKDFYEKIRSIMNPDGIFATQAGSTFYRRREFDLVRARVEDVFSHTLAYKALVPSYCDEWGFVLASPSPIPASCLDTLRALGCTTV